MNQILDFKRTIEGCFHLYIPLDPETEVRQAIHNSMVVERAVKLMLTGQASPDEILDLIEPVVENVDDYISEVEENLEIYLGN